MGGFRKYWPDGVNTYTYNGENRLVAYSNGTDTYEYTYNGLGDRLSQTVDGVTKEYTLDLNTGLTQVLTDGENTYLYGLSRLGQGATTTEYFLGDALGSVRQLVDSTGGITLTKSYTPFGEVLSESGTGESIYGYTGEVTDASGLVYLRARYYLPGSGRFISRDTWDGKYVDPITLIEWIYVSNNPVLLRDPSGHISTAYGIEIDDSFSDEELELIKETISDFANLLGGYQALRRNLNFNKIIRGWTSYNVNGVTNAEYLSWNKSITLQPGWYSAVITKSIGGTNRIILGPGCLSDWRWFRGYPNPPSDPFKTESKFILVHEMTHALRDGNTTAFNSFKDNVDLPPSILAKFSSNPLIKRAWRRDVASEVFSDAIAAYLYWPDLLNQQMFDWIQFKLPDTIK